MKIIYLHQYFNTPQMNGGTRSYEMALRLVRAGHDVHMITTDRKLGTGSAGWREELIDGINLYWYKVPYSNSFGFVRRLQAFLQFAIASGKKAVQLGGDLVFATSTPLTIAIPGVYASKKLSVPFVFEVRDLWPELPIAIGAIRNPVLKLLARWLERYAYNNANKIIALSPGMADGVVKSGYAPENVTVVPNLANTELFNSGKEAHDKFVASHNFLKGKKTILYAGTIGRINGVVYLAQIASILKDLDRSILFLVVGEGSETESLCRTARDLQVLNRNFFHLPSVSKAEMPALFSIATLGCSIFIDLSEMWPNSANKFFDTLAAGKPIMINYQGWQAEEIRSSGAGIVIPPDNPVEAAQLIQQFLADEERVAAAGRAAYELARRKYEVNVLFDDFLQTIESAAGGR